MGYAVLDTEIGGIRLEMITFNKKIEEDVSS